jgi:hypothetical protein
MFHAVELKTIIVDFEPDWCRDSSVKLSTQWRETKPVGVGWSEPEAPLAYRFVGYDDATFGQQVFDISEA